MPRRKPPTIPSEPPWQVILEEIRSEYQTVREAIEAARRALEQRIDHLERQICARATAIEKGVRN